MLIYYFLPFIVFLGIITSYEDIKTGKIRNKWILGAIFFAIAIYFALFLTKQISQEEIFLTLINFAIAIVFSFLLWNFKFWSAGDGKLFIGYAALIPINVYSGTFVSFFHSFNLFVNVFVLFFAYLVLGNIFSVGLKKAKEGFIKSAKSFPEIFVAMLAIGWLVPKISFFIGVQDQLSSFVIYASAYFLINLGIKKALSAFKLKKTRPVHIFIFIAGLRLIFDIENIFAAQFIIPILLSSVLYVLVLRSLFSMIETTTYRNVEITKLKKGDLVCKIELEETKKSILDFIRIEPEGLSGKNLEDIKKMCKKLKIKTVPVACAAPFAPAIFVGVLITISVGNIANLIYLLAHFFSLARGLF